MKYLKTIICVLLVSVLFTGCSFRLSSSIDDLISPLSPFGDNADVKEALDSFSPNGYTLKMPNYGKNISSYNFYDIDGDKTDEAVAFYEPSDNLGTINLALIKKTDNEWRVICNIAGIGKDVHSLDFAQLNGDGNKELVVCWDAISNSSNHELAVYKYIDNSKAPKLEMLGESKTVNTCYVVDMFNDGDKKLLLFEGNSGSSSSPKAELYSLTDERFELLGETRLDARIATFVSIKSEIIDGMCRVYADAISSDGSTMITELLYWSDDYDSIISPFYRYSTARTEGTSRIALLPSMDTDGDKLLEIPLDFTVKKIPDGVKAIEFNNYRHSTLIHNSYAFFVPDDKYVFIIPDKYISSFTVKYSQKTREMTLINKSTKKTVLSIMPVLKATYIDGKYSGYVTVLEDSGYCYLAKKGNDESIKFSIEEIKNSIKSTD